MTINKALAKFLAAKKRPKKTMNYPCLHGFLYAVASSPETITIQQWLPLVFNNQAAKFKNISQEVLITSQLQVVYDEINRQIEQGGYGLPDAFSPSPNVMQNFDYDSPLAHWSRGFLIADDWMENLWLTYLPEQMMEERNSYLLTLGFFADKNRTQTLCEQKFGGELSLETVAETMLDSFKHALMAYSQTGRQIRKALVNP